MKSLSFILLLLTLTHLSSQACNADLMKLYIEGDADGTSLEKELPAVTILDASVEVTTDADKAKPCGEIYSTNGGTCVNQEELGTRIKALKKRLSATFGGFKFRNNFAKGQQNKNLEALKSSTVENCNKLKTDASAYVSIAKEGDSTATKATLEALADTCLDWYNNKYDELQGLQEKAVDKNAIQKCYKSYADATFNTLCYATSVEGPNLILNQDGQTLINIESFKTLVADCKHLWYYNSIVNSLNSISVVLTKKDEGNTGTATFLKYDKDLIAQLKTVVDSDKGCDGDVACQEALAGLISFAGRNRIIFPDNEGADISAHCGKSLKKGIKLNAENFEPQYISKDAGKPKDDFKKELKEKKTELENKAKEKVKKIKEKMTKFKANKGKSKKDIEDKKAQGEAIPKLGLWGKKTQNSLDMFFRFSVHGSLVAAINRIFKVNLANTGTKTTDLTDIGTHLVTRIDLLKSYGDLLKNTIKKIDTDIKKELKAGTIQDFVKNLEFKPEDLKKPMANLDKSLERMKDSSTKVTAAAGTFVTSLEAKAENKKGDDLEFTGNFAGLFTYIITAKGMGKISPEFSGLSIELTAEGGKFKSTWTRDTATVGGTTATRFVGSVGDGTNEFFSGTYDVTADSTKRLISVTEKVSETTIVLTRTSATPTIEVTKKNGEKVTFTITDKDGSTPASATYVMVKGTVAASRRILATAEDNGSTTTDVGGVTTENESGETVSADDVSSDMSGAETSDPETNDSFKRIIGIAGSLLCLAFMNLM